VFLQVGGTAIVQVVNFIVFLILLNIVFTGPVGRAIAKRRAYINGLSSDIERAQADVKALRAQAEAKRAAARREADEVIAKARATAQNESADVQAGFAARATTIVHEADRTVAAEVASARAKEEEIVAALSRTLLERALGPGAAA
jgi:F-type H+-transporting ATPase subunit b